MLLAISSSHLALYQVSVRWVRCLPLTSFIFHLAMDTLVSLAGRFPLPGLVRDLHPLDDTHAGQTKMSRITLWRAIRHDDYLVQGGNRRLRCTRLGNTSNNEWKCVLAREITDRILFSRLFSHAIMILRETLFTRFTWTDMMPSLAENQEVFKIDVFSHCFPDK